MDTDTILRNFGRRVVCTQQVCTRFAPRLGISRAQALGMGAAFGSDMGHAETCGCVTGAQLVLGLQFGPQNEETAATAAERLQEQVAVFEERFLAKQHSLICKEILGADISRPEGMAVVMQKGLFAAVCAPMVAATCEILGEMLATETTQP